MEEEEEGLGDSGFNHYSMQSLPFPGTFVANTLLPSILPSKALGPHAATVLREMERCAPVAMATFARSDQIPPLTVGLHNGGVDVLDLQTKISFTQGSFRPLRSL